MIEYKNNFPKFGLVEINKLNIFYATRASTFALIPLVTPRIWWTRVVIYLEYNKGLLKSRLYHFRIFA